MTGEAQTAGKPDGDGLAAVAVLEAFSGRLRKALAGYYLARQAWTIGKAWAEKGRAARSYSVTVEGSDRVYPDLQEWLVDKIPKADRRSLTAYTRRSDGPVDVAPSGGPDPAARVRVAYDGLRAQHVELGGRQVRVEVTLPSWISSASGIDASRFADLMRMTFTCPDEASRDAVLVLLADLAKAGDGRAPQFFVASQWGGWIRREHPGRPLDSIVLPGGQLERIDADLARFLDDEAAYRRLGTPWHRGYVFHGPPGTGKTSLARGLSTEHRLDLYYLPLSSVKNDAALLELFGNISDRAMLLIEDVDVAHGSRTRDDGEPGVTLSGLLNALDGVATPNGLVSVLTTNEVAVLDPALMRAGRADVVEEFRLLDGEHLAAIARRLGDVTLTSATDPRGASPADAVEVIKAHLRGSRLETAGALTRLSAR